MNVRMLLENTKLVRLSLYLTKILALGLWLWQIKFCVSVITCLIYWTSSKILRTSITCLSWQHDGSITTQSCQQHGTKHSFQFAIALKTRAERALYQGLLNRRRQALCCCKTATWRACIVLSRTPSTVKHITASVGNIQQGVRDLAQ